MTGLRRQERHILSMHAILDSFGSCSTTRNTNSSRLGKVVRVYFPATTSSDSSGKEVYTNQIATTQIEIAMLDRGRLQNFPMCIGQERNFHIFYQLLAGYPILNSLQPEDFAKFLFGDEIGIDLQKDDQVVDGIDDRTGTLFSFFFYGYF